MASRALIIIPFSNWLLRSSSRKELKIIISGIYYNWKEKQRMIQNKTTHVEIGCSCWSVIFKLGYRGRDRLLILYYLFIILFWIMHLFLFQRRLQLVILCLLFLSLSLSHVKVVQFPIQLEVACLFS